MADVMQYREVRQRFSVRDDDGPDSDLLPDRHTVTGTVEFTPKLPKGDVIAYPEEFVKPMPITGRIIAGELFANWAESDQEEPRPLHLPVTVDDEADQTWSWIMRVSSLLIDGQEASIKMGDREFQVEAGDGPLWLSTVAAAAKGSGTITISGPDGVFIDSIEEDATGLTVHNAGRPSSSAADWVSGNTSSTWSHVFPTTFASEANNENQPKPDLALVQPLLNGSQPADIRQVVANVQALNIPTVLVTCGGVGGMTGGSTVPTQIAALYDAADEFDLPLIDLTDTMGWYATANPKGLMADTVHPNRRGYSVQAWRIYRALIGA